MYRLRKKLAIKRCILFSYKIIIEQQKERCVKQTKTRLSICILPFLNEQKSENIEINKT